MKKNVVFSIKGAVGFILMAAAALGDTHSASCNVTVDTRTAAVTSLTITGPDSVIGGSTATYTCTAHYADGSQADVSSLCTWSFVGTVPSGTYLYGPSLATASSFSSQTVQIRAAYQRPEGQKASSPFTVSITAEDAMQAKLCNSRAEGISPGVWEVSAEVSAFGCYGNVQCEWKLDGVVLSGVTGTELTRYPISGGVLGNRLLSVRVTDAHNQIANASQLVTFNKPPVTDKEVRYPINDPDNGDILDTAGFQYEQYHDWKTLKQNGLIILTHGYTDSGASSWIKIMGIFIEDRLTHEGKPLPNICIYDWSKVSQPAQAIYDAAENAKINGWLNRLNPAYYIMKANGWLVGVFAIHPVACSQGIALEKWIKQQVDAGNIDSTKPIHLIGHSAGGFVVSECAYQLKNQGIISGDIQYTTLDTPTAFPTDRKWFNFSDGAGRSCRMERYDVATGVGGLFSPYDWPVADAGYYRRTVFSIINIGLLSAHFYVNHWYSYDTAHPNASEYDGFYYSPFMDNGFHGVEFGQNAQAFARASDAPASTASVIPDEPLTGFETFGSVTLSNGLYQVIEEANAGLVKEIALPVGAQSVKFNYRFATAGDGDYFVVYWGTNGIPLYIGSDLQLSGTGFMEGEAPVNIFAGDTNRLTFILVSRGQTNAVLELKDIALTLSDDPDYDGLTTSEEITLGTNPLNADTDGDGLSDFDEVHTYLTDPLLTDSDGDGMSDFNEIQAGSDPNDPDSCFKITSLTPLPTGGMRLTWQGKAGRHYRVNRCDHLGTGAYTTLATGVSGMEPQTSFDDTQGSSCAFYWVEQEP